MKIVTLVVGTAYNFGRASIKCVMDNAYYCIKPSDITIRPCLTARAKQWIMQPVPHPPRGHLANSTCCLAYFLCCLAREFIT